MDDNRLKAQNMFLSICPNVYFQKPSNTNMKYPAIIYSRTDIVATYANDNAYMRKYSYDVTVIDRNPDSKIAEELLNFRFCKFNRQFVSDGLNHIVFKIYI